MYINKDQSEFSEMYNNYIRVNLTSVKSEKNKYKKDTLQSEKNNDKSEKIQK